MLKSRALRVGVKFYNRATQMADRGPNPDLWVVPAGPRQLLKRLFFTQKFLSQNLALLAMLLKKQLLAKRMSDCKHLTIVN